MEAAWASDCSDVRGMSAVVYVFARARVCACMRELCGIHLTCAV